MNTIEEVQQEIKALKAQLEPTTTYEEKVVIMREVTRLMFVLAKLYKKEIKLK
jgi:hypothetical protein